MLTVKTEDEEKVYYQSLAIQNSSPQKTQRLGKPMCVGVGSGRLGGAVRLL